MPLKPGASRAAISDNISELHQGKTYARTSAKFGNTKANAQAVAIAMRQAGKARRPKTSKAGSVLD